MHTTFHAGRCCALKSISNLGSTPFYLVDAIEETKYVEPDMHNYHFKTDTRFWNEAAPKEPGIDRMKRIIQWCRKNRPGMILEAATVHGSNVGGRVHTPWTPQDAWIPVLQELGFRCVNEVINSNTNYLIKVWHLNIAEGKYATGVPA